MVRTLTETDNALTLPIYRADGQTEEVEVNFTDEGIRHWPKIAAMWNSPCENIGARRPVHRMVERVF